MFIRIVSLFGKFNPTCFKYPKYERNEEEEKKTHQRDDLISIIRGPLSISLFIFLFFIHHFLFINGRQPKEQQ
jgi:hypothetical protein